MTGTNKHARRISSMFSLGSSKDEPVSRLQHRPISQVSNTPPQGMSPSPQLQPPPTNLVPPTPDSPQFNPLLLPPSLSQINTSVAMASGESSSRPGSREGSRSRPTTSGGLAPGSSASSPRSDGKLAKRRSFKPAKDKSGKSAQGQRAGWIAGLPQHVPYDLTNLLRGEKVADLWDEMGDTFIYLFPQNTGKGPSFKVRSNLFASSRNLLSLSRSDSQRSSISGQSGRGFTDPYGLSNAIQNMSLRATHGRHRSGSNNSSNEFPDDQYLESHIFVPLPFEGDISTSQAQLTDEDFELLVLYRNFFSFLAGGSLVATYRQESLYIIFMGISSVLQRFEFSNLDMSTYGEIPANSFANYCNELRLRDVRNSPEKTIEAIVLGERMKFFPLYNEGFVHGAGKLDDLKAADSPKFNHISPITRNRLERAFFDLEGRVKTIQYKLDSLEFPSFFSGIANSKTLQEAKAVRFDAWKTSFFNFRKHVIAHYRQRYGAWPPKASSKKNDFSESGLNRLLLNEVYEDFTNLYDLLVDRQSMTTRAVNIPTDPEEEVDPTESTARALRGVLSEYDRSTPPVQPPIPFDIPLIPSTTTLRQGKKEFKKLKDNQVNEILLASCNHGSIKMTPFIEDFMRFERRSGHNATIDEIADTRCGQWLFMYAVLQSMPMVVVDAKDVEFTQGVEYFLCQPPRGHAPWMKEDSVLSRKWYNVAGAAGGVVNLPTDVVEHGIEAIYQRSHCWQVATEWAGTDNILTTEVVERDGLSPLPPSQPRRSSQQASPYLTPHSSPGLLPVRASQSSPDSFAMTNRRSSMVLGLEALPLPPGVSPDPMVMPTNNHNYDPNKTFDSFLGTAAKPHGKKGKK